MKFRVTEDKDDQLLSRLAQAVSEIQSQTNQSLLYILSVTDKSSLLFFTVRQDS